MNVVQAYALQSACFSVAAMGAGSLIAILIVTPISRAIAAASDRFWDAADLRRAARR